MAIESDRDRAGEDALTQDPLLVDGWAYAAPARVARAMLQTLVLFPVLRFVVPVQVRGRRHLRAVVPPVIVVANHVSHLDTPVVLRALPRRIRSRMVVAAAKDYFYRRRVIGALVSLSLATIPFDRDKGSAESLRQCRGLLDRGWSLLLFPEGTRSASGELGRVRHGVSVLAVGAGVPVLPVYVHGLSDVMPKGTAAPLPGGVLVAAGEPLRPAPGDDVKDFHARVEEGLRTLAARAPSWGGATESAAEPARDATGDSY